MQPDEQLVAGPFRVARFGNLVHWSSQLTEEDINELHRELARQHPQIVADINQIVAEIAVVVSRLPALQLLHRARMSLMMMYLKPKSEAEVSEDDVLAYRMVDYIQSVIAAISPSEPQHAEVTDEEWNNLEGKVKSLFEKINNEYPFSSTASMRLNDPKYNADFENFKFQAQLFWCNVRGHRYEAHIPTYLSDMFMPYSEILQDLFDISGNQFVEEFTKIRDSLVFGHGNAFEGLMQFRQDTLDAVKLKLSAEEFRSEKDFRKIMADVIEENGWEQRRTDVWGQAFGTDLFDIGKFTNLPKSLLHELALSPGQEKDFFAEGEYQGWPLRIWPTFKRPFIHIDGRFYCFDTHLLFDNLYRVMQRIVLGRRPDYRERWNNVQQKLSENLTFKYLQQILPKSTVWQSAFYKGITNSGRKGWCEVDGLFAFDDHLFIIECKGGAFTYTSPADDFPAHVKSLHNLVTQPAAQGKRFLEFLGTSDVVSIFDKDHKKVDEIRKMDFRHITVCSITLDQFTEFAARVQHLGPIGICQVDSPTWSVSLDDLRVFSDLFTNPLIFIHFVEQRLRAFESDAVECNDELDHVGLYFKHNHYAHYFEGLINSKSDQLNFIGYRSEIDGFFSQRLLNPETPCLLNQNIPLRIAEIIDFLASSRESGRSKVASYLLNTSGEWRERISNSIENKLRRQRDTKQPSPISSHGDVNLTLVCWKPSSTYRDAAFALEHARVVSCLNNDETRLLLELTYSHNDTLEDVSWQWINAALIPEHLKPALLAKANQLRNRRVANREKIGRNESCPCGSGIKWKKCCLLRTW